MTKIKEIRKRKKYFNFEELGNDLEDVLLKLHIKLGAPMFDLDKIVEEKKEIVIEKTKEFVRSADIKINEFIGDTIDNLYYGKTENASYVASMEENVVGKRKNIAFESIKEVLSGKFYASYTVKDRKPRLLWRWKDRMEFIQGFFANYRSEKSEVNELLLIINRNSYLKRRHRDMYEKLSFYLRE